ncbi:MAG: response regulator transcription factor [Pseudomonadota bacterium]
MFEIEHTESTTPVDDEGKLLDDKLPSLRVLLVDDDDILREGMIQILRADATMCIVGEAADGDEALQMAMKTRPDIVVMDLSMPRLDGVAATRAILEAVPNTEILAVSVYTDMDRAREVIDAGAMGYVVKAGAPRYLLPAVHALANGNVFFSPGISGQLFQKLNKAG